MTVVAVRIRVAPDRSISGIAPAALPPGEHLARVGLAAAPKPRRSVLDLPVHRGSWDDGASLRREDMYDDDGR